MRTIHKEILDRLLVNLPIFDKINDNGISKIYFKDRSISSEELYLSIDSLTSDVLISTLKLEQSSKNWSDYKFSLSYNLDDMTGEFSISSDQMLSDASCAGLYTYNIDITAICFLTATILPEVYDKTAIMRRDSINNIIT